MLGRHSYIAGELRGKTLMHILIAGYPGKSGGADVECWHLCDAFIKAGIGVHLVPFGDPDPQWRAEMDAMGCVTHRWDPQIFRGQVVLNFCSRDFLERIAEIKAAGGTTVWANCMARQVFPLEIEAHAKGLIDWFVYQSKYQRTIHVTQLERSGPVRVLEGYRPYFSWQRGTEEGIWAPGCACNLNPETFNIGRVSRDDYHKYPDAFWETYGKVNAGERKVRAFVLGYGKNARQHCGDVPEWATVWEENAIPSNDLFSRLHCMIHITSASGENWPRVLFEAWASGVVPVMENDGGPAELITDGVDGFLVPKNNPDAIAAAASRIAQDDALRVQMVKAGYETLLREHCDVERSVAPFRALLEGCPEVTAPPMPKRGGIDVSRIAAINEGQNQLIRDGANRFMVAQWYVKDGQIHLNRHDHHFPDEDKAKAVEMLRADLRPARTPGKPRSLCVCYFGHNRSTCLKKILESKGHVSVAIGGATSGDAMEILAPWADHIFVVQPNFADFVPAEHREKVVVFDIGGDVWGSAQHPDLIAKLEAMYQEWVQKTGAAA